MTVGRTQWRHTRRFALAAVLAVASLAALPTLVGSGAPAKSSSSGSQTTAPGAAEPTPSATARSSTSIPMLAFYYQWFETNSWDRAKTDYPTLGRYSSDDPRVIRQHIRWAKSAGIDGFIVSWKDSPTRDRRLRLLMEIANEENFKVAMIYQGLDFYRKPLPVSRVAADFAMFADTFGNDPSLFRWGGKPLTIWSGTWAYSREDVASVTSQVRHRMLVLNTEKNAKGYERIADITDGDAYYWSSVDPETNDNYESKLAELGQTVHSHGGFWIAPVAPGFDARLVGGTQTVERQNGATLRTEYAVALRSSPDAIGLISWNEFSENSHVEPSVKYRDAALRVLRELRQTATPVPPSATDSSDPGSDLDPTTSSRWLNAALLAVFLGLLVGVGALSRRRADVAPEAKHGLPINAAKDEDEEEIYVRW